MMVFFDEFKGLFLASSCSFHLGKVGLAWNFDSAVALWV